MQTLILALMLCLQNALPTSEAVAALRKNSSSVNVLGSWEGRLLPPGITPFETIRSTTTFRPDGTFSIRAFKPTGNFQCDGTYAVLGNVLTLSLSLNTVTPTRYQFSRRGDTLSLRPLGEQAEALTLSSLNRAFP